MKSWSSWVYLAVSVASVVFAALQPAHQVALDLGLASVAREGWNATWSGAGSAAQGR